MKQKALSLFLCLLLLSALVLNVSAASELPLVIDDANLLTNAERSHLENTADAIRSEYGIDVVILTVNGLGAKSARNFADDYYDRNGYADDGVLFLLAMEEREWYISTCGKAIRSLSDAEIQELGDTAVWYLSDGDYYEGFAAYLDTLHSCLAGRPIWLSLVVALLIGVAAAGIAILIMRSQMNTKRPQRSAGSYLTSGSYQLRVHQDMFLYSDVRKVRRQQNNSSGGSSHRSSSGRRHGGGGGRF